MAEQTIRAFANGNAELKSKHADGNSGRFWESYNNEISEVARINPRSRPLKRNNLKLGECQAGFHTDFHIILVTVPFQTGNGFKCPTKFQGQQFRASKQIPVLVSQKQGRPPNHLPNWYLPIPHPTNAVYSRARSRIRPIFGKESFSTILILENITAPNWPKLL